MASSPGTPTGSPDADERDTEERIRAELGIESSGSQGFNLEAELNNALARREPEVVADEDSLEEVESRAEEDQQSLFGHGRVDDHDNDGDKDAPADDHDNEAPLNLDDSDSDSDKDPEEEENAIFDMITVATALHNRVEETAYTREYLRAIDSFINDAASFASLLPYLADAHRNKNRDRFAEDITRQRLRDQYLEIVEWGERMHKASPRKRPREEA